MLMLSNATYHTLSRHLGPIWGYELYLKKSKLVWLKYLLSKSCLDLIQRKTKVMCTYHNFSFITKILCAIQLILINILLNRASIRLLLCKRYLYKCFVWQRSNTFYRTIIYKAPLNMTIFKVSIIINTLATM